MIDIRTVMEKYGYSKQMLADKLGCSHQSIMQLVNPGSNPTYKKMQLIADAMGADIREFFPSAEDIKMSKEIRGSFDCPVCGKPIHLENGIEIGNIFQLGTKYTSSMEMTVLGKDGKSVYFGIGIDHDIIRASIDALLSAFNRSLDNQ